MPAASPGAKVDFCSVTKGVESPHAHVVRAGARNWVVDTSPSSWNGHTFGRRWTKGTVRPSVTLMGLYSSSACQLGMYFNRIKM